MNKKINNRKYNLNENLFCLSALCLSISLCVYASICLFVYQPMCLFICLSIYLFMCPFVYLPFFWQPIYLSFSLPVYFSTYLSTYLFIYLCIFLSIYRFIFLCICLSICSHCSEEFDRPRKEFSGSCGRILSEFENKLTKGWYSWRWSGKKVN